MTKDTMREIVVGLETSLANINLLADKVSQMEEKELLTMLGGEQVLLATLGGCNKISEEVNKLKRKLRRLLNESEA